MNRNPSLLLALVRHTHTDFAHEPFLEPFARLQRSASHDQRIRVERVHHLVKEQSQGMRLHSKNFPAETISLLPKSTYELCRLVRFQSRQFVPRISRQKIGQQISLDRGQGTQRFQVPNTSAIANWLDSVGSGDAYV